MLYKLLLHLPLRFNTCSAHTHTKKCVATLVAADLCEGSVCYICRCSQALLGQAISPRLVLHSPRPQGIQNCVLGIKGRALISRWQVLMFVNCMNIVQLQLCDACCCRALASLVVQLQPSAPSHQESLPCLTLSNPHTTTSNAFLSATTTAPI